MHVLGQMSQAFFPPFPSLLLGGHPFRRYIPHQQLLFCLQEGREDLSEEWSFLRIPLPAREHQFVHLRRTYLRTGQIQSLLQLLDALLAIQACIGFFAKCEDY